MSYHPPWPAKQDQLLRKLINGGTSRGMIAKLMGRTRSSVIARAYRLKLTVWTNPTHTRRASVPPAQKAIAPTPKAKPMPIAEPQEASRVTLLELTNETCRWPMGTPGTPEFMFCGGPADLVGGHVYCGFHHRIGYHPVRPVYVTGRAVA